MNGIRSLLCRIGIHAWGRWSDPYFVRMVSAFTEPYRAEFQKRTCVLCGLIVEREI